MKLSIGRALVASPQVILIPISANEGDLAEAAAGHDLARLLEVRPTSLLHAGLHHALRFGDGLQQRLAFLDAVRDRLLDVDVFARAHRVDSHGDVPVIGRADHDRIDIGLFQQLAVIGELARFGRYFLARFLAVRFVDIADGHDLAAAALVQQAQQILAASASADAANADAVVRAQNAAVRCGRGEGRGLDECAAVCHGCSSCHASMPSSFHGAR